MSKENGLLCLHSENDITDLKGYAKIVKLCLPHSFLPVFLLLENTMGSILIRGYCCLSRICFENQMSSLPCVLTLSSVVMDFQFISFHLSHNLTLHLIDFQDIKKLIFCVSSVSL